MGTHKAVDVVVTATTRVTLYREFRNFANWVRQLAIATKLTKGSGCPNGRRLTGLRLENDTKPHSLFPSEWLTRREYCLEIFSEEKVLNFSYSVSRKRNKICTDVVDQKKSMDIIPTEGTASTLFIADALADLINCQQQWYS